MRNRYYPIGGILCGILSIIFAIVILSGNNTNLVGMSTGTRTSYDWYGGDAYTGIQQAAADTARNVSDLAKIVQVGFQEQNGTGIGYLLLILGIWIFMHSLHVLNEIKARDQFEGKVLTALNRIPSFEPETALSEINEAEAYNEAYADENNEHGATNMSGSIDSEPTDETDDQESAGIEET